MTDSPTPAGAPLPNTNPIESGLDTALSVGGTAVVDAIETAVIAAEPEMATPVWKQIWESLLSWIVGTLDKTGQLFLTFKINKAQGSAQNSALNGADKEVQTALQSGDPNALAKAEQDFQKSESAAVNYGGSAHPQ